MILKSNKSLSKVHIWDFAYENYERELSECLEHLASSDGDNLSKLAADVLCRIAILHVVTGDQEAALKFAKESYEKSLAISYEAGMYWGLYNTGIIHAQNGEVADALTYMEQSLNICRQNADFRFRIVPTYSNMAELLVILGKLTEAENILDKTVEVYKQLNSEECLLSAICIGNAYFRLAHQNFEECNYDKARANVNLAIPILSITGLTTSLLLVHLVHLRIIYNDSYDAYEFKSKFELIKALIKDQIRENADDFELAWHLITESEYWLLKHEIEVVSYFVNASEIIFGHKSDSDDCLPYKRTL